MIKYDALKANLVKSPFRSRFKLKEKDLVYIAEKGFDTIALQATQIISSRLGPANPVNDGSQTPMKGHVVFIAQHATATCCRGCLYKWHKIPQNVELSEEQIDYVVTLIMKWIEKEYINYNKNRNNIFCCF